MKSIRQIQPDENPIGFQVTWTLHGRQLLGDVIGVDGKFLIIRHFDGSLWEFKPCRDSVEVLG